MKVKLSGSDGGCGCGGIGGVGASASAVSTLGCQLQPREIQVNVAAWPESALRSQRQPYHPQAKGVGQRRDLLASAQQVRSKRARGNPTTASHPIGSLECQPVASVADGHEDEDDARQRRRPLTEVR